MIPILLSISRARVGEETYASPAVSQEQNFLRGVDHLFAIGNAR